MPPPCGRWMCYLLDRDKDIGARRNTIFPTRRLESGVKDDTAAVSTLVFHGLRPDAYSAAF